MCKLINIKILEEKMLFWLSFNDVKKYLIKMDLYHFWIMFCCHIIIDYLPNKAMTSFICLILRLTFIIIT